MRVVILGGGMAGLTAAWALTDPDAAADIESVTVYQRGWRLGGKGASSRGLHGRIEEHGLHVWLGYYDNAFRMMREVYEELNRPVTAPECPIRSLADVFIASGRVGVAEDDHGRWSSWVSTFAGNPGEQGVSTDGPLTVAEFVRRSIQLLLSLSTSLGRADHSGPRQGVFLTSGARPLGTGGIDPLVGSARIGDLARQAEMAAVMAALTAVELLGPAGRPDLPLQSVVVEHIDRLRSEWLDRSRRDEVGRRMWQVFGLISTCARGAVEDGLLTAPAGFAAIDHLDFREWLASHNASAEVLDSPLVRGMYDLVFAYESGNPRRPRFAAGLGLFLAYKFFFQYRGSIFFKMRMGMGEAVFAPLYEVLRARGVRFEFFNRVDNLHLSPDRRSVAAVTMARQARVTDGKPYEPLITVHGVPCFPSGPKQEQLTAAVAADLESHWADRRAEKLNVLAAGADFDAVVLATSLGMVPYVCRELMYDSSRWRQMVRAIPTVATQALQLWLLSTDIDLGVPPGGPTISGLGAPFETYASMAHLLAQEEWPDDDRPGTVAYLCGTLRDEEARSPATSHRAVRRHALEFLEDRAGDLWPGAIDRAGRFRWDLLAGSVESDGPARLDSQYWRANIDPSDRYVQSPPGSGVHRLRADEAGYDNLFLAGDWINCGLNAGCIEAAVMAGLHAANAVRSRPLVEGVTGSWYGLKPTDFTTEPVAGEL
jgi:uncharacterized protein with NAD-binding domain and iron-sulfur cluster